MNICVTSIGSIAGTFVVKRLKQLGHHVTGVNISGSMCLAQKLCDNFLHVPHSNMEDEYLKKILSLARDLKINSILPLTDPEAYILASNAEIFKGKGVNILTPNSNSLALVRDKFNLFEDCSKWHTDGFGAIPSYTNPADALKKFGFPLLGKPAIGRSRQGHILITSKKNKFITHKNYIYQPYIDGSVITVDAIRKANGNLFYCLSRLELERTANGAGTKVKIFQDQHINRFIKKVLDFYCINGCVNLELLNKNNFYYLMDFNLRLSAGIEFSYQAGADFIGALLSDDFTFNNYFSNKESMILERSPTETDVEP